MTLSPQIVDLILGIVAAEVILVSFWLARKKRQDLIPALVCFLASGGLLMIALRATLAPAPNQGLILGLLAASFPVHVATLILGWRALKRH